MNEEENDDLDIRYPYRDPSNCEDGDEDKHLQLLIHETFLKQDLVSRQQDPTERQSGEIKDILKKAEYMVSHLKYSLQTTKKILNRYLSRLIAMIPVSEEIRLQRQDVVQRVRVYVTRIDEKIKTLSRNGETLSSDDSDSSTTDTESSDSSTDSSDDDSGDEKAYFEKLIAAKTAELEKRRKLSRVYRRRVSRRKLQF